MGSEQPRLVLDGSRGQPAVGTDDGAIRPKHLEDRSALPGQHAAGRVHGRHQAVRGSDALARLGLISARPQTFALASSNVASARSTWPFRTLDTPESQAFQNQ